MSKPDLSKPDLKEWAPGVEPKKAAKVLRWAVQTLCEEHGADRADVVCPPKMEDVSSRDVFVLGHGTALLELDALAKRLDSA